MPEDWGVRRYRSLLLLLLPLFWWISASPASAHDQLVSTTPSADSNVTAPKSVRLTFSDTVIETGTRIEIRNSSGTLVAGTPAVSATIVSVALPAALPAGPYKVVWRVTSADGHPVSGKFTFTAIAAATSSSSTSAAGSSSATDSATSDTTSATGGSVASASATPTQRVPTNSTNNEPGWVLGAVGVAVLAIVAAVAISRKRLTDDEPQDGPADREE